MSVSSRCDVMEFSEKDPLLNFYANLVVQLVHRPDEINVGVSHFRSLKWETLTLRLCVLIELIHCFAGR